MRFPDFKRFRERYLMPFTLTLMVAGLVFAYLSPLILVTVPAGHLGVMWYRFGKGTDVCNIVHEGTHLKLPWNLMYVYDARLLVVDQEYDAITKDGLLVQTSISFRFHINRQWVGLLHKEVGINYLHVLLIPEIGDTARQEIANNTAEEFYTTHRDQVSESIRKTMDNSLYKHDDADECKTMSSKGVKLVEIDDVMVKGITLPDSIMAAIEAKIQQYQRLLEYAFRVKSEEKEKERKKIEGEGVRAMFDRIGARDLPSYLRMVGINATLELARSNNAKVIVSGAPGGLPLILGTDVLAPSPLQPQPKASETAKGEPAPPP